MKEQQRPTLLMACSGASNVGEITDLAARKLFREGSVVMTCPTAIAGRIESQLKRIQKESNVIVLDGCEKDCVCRTLKFAGFSSFVHIRLNDIGLTKGGAPVNEETVDRVVKHVMSLIKTSSLWEETFSFSYDSSKAVPYKA